MMKEYQLRMHHLDDNGTLIKPSLKNGAKKVIMIVHDETTICANDATKIIWYNPDDGPFRIRDTTFTNANGQVVQQSMVTAGRNQKGIKTILSERGLWDDLDHKKPQCPI